MKKLFTLLAVGGLAVASQAAQLDWKYDASSADVGQTIYVMIGTEAVQQWENLAAVQEASVGSGTVAKKGRTAYAAEGSISSDSIKKDDGGTSVYYVVVDADGEKFSVTSVSDMTASVYDPSAQESSPGANGSLSSGSITSSGIAWGTGGGDDPGTGGGDDPGTGGGDDPGTGGGDDPGTGGGDDPGTGGGDDPGTGGQGGVPEPTSGILLMLGGAVLALRRRR